MRVPRTLRACRRSFELIMFVWFWAPTNTLLDGACVRAPPPDLPNLIPSSYAYRALSALERFGCAPSTSEKTSLDFARVQKEIRPDWPNVPLCTNLVLCQNASCREELPRCASPSWCKENEHAVDGVHLYVLHGDGRAQHTKHLEKWSVCVFEVTCTKCGRAHRLDRSVVYGAGRSEIQNVYCYDAHASLPFVEVWRCVLSGLVIRLSRPRFVNAVVSCRARSPDHNWHNYWRIPVQRYHG